MLPGQTLAKLLRETFRGAEVDLAGLIDVPSSEQKVWFTQLVARFHGNSRVSLRIEESRGNGSTYLSMKIAGVSEKRNPDDWFQLQFMTFEDLRGLFLVDANFRRRTKNPPVPVQRIEQIESFVDAVLARQDREHLRSKKTEKLVGFQKKGLTARLRELGKQQGFAFAVNENARDIKLSIRIEGRKSGYHFSFVKTKLEGMLEQLPELVHMLQKMQSLGIHFTTANKILKRSMQQELKWIEPEMEQVE